MIHTIIFDIGRVLVKFEWREYLAGFHFSPEAEKAIGKAMFLNPVWQEYDRGALPDEEILALVYQSAPRYKEEIRNVFEQFPSCLELLPHAIPWIKDLKERGYRIYYLSNYAQTTRLKNPEALSFLPFCDGGLFSYEVKLVKPEPAIYRELFSRFSIVPEQAVFIDDTLGNLEAAETFGLRTVHFKDYASASASLDALLANG